MYILLEHGGDMVSQPVALSADPHVLAELADSLLPDCPFDYREIGEWRPHFWLPEAIYRVIVWPDWNYYQQAIVYVKEI